MDQNNEDARNQVKSKRILGILIVIGIIVYGTIAAGSPGLTVGFDQENPVRYFYFQYSGRDVETVRYEIYLEDVISVSYVKEHQLGEMVDGVDTNAMTFGIWHNEAYGDYKLGIVDKIDSYVLVETKSGYAVLNYESDSTTEQLAKAIQELADETHGSAA